MSRKADYSKKILKLLAEKPATAVLEIYGKVTSESATKEVQYAISRSLRGLKTSGLIEGAFSGQNEYARLTREGKKRLHSLNLEQENTLINPAWDGKWRIVMLDLPENRKDERDSLRYLLKKAGFLLLKNSIWISPFPYEYLFMNLKKDFGLTTELMIFVTDTIDPETKDAFFEALKTGTTL